MPNAPITYEMPLVIVEDGPNARPYGGETIVLEKDDAPMGQARSEVGFEQGGELHLGQAGGTYYPGRRRASHTVNQFRFTDPTFHGALRDHLWGEAGHSQKIADALIRVASRARYCSVTWGDYSFYALLGKPKLEREDTNDWRYELTFFLSEVSGSEDKDSAQQSKARTTEVLSEVLADLRRQMAEHRAKIAALQIQVAIRNNLLGACDGIETALLSAQRAAVALESATIGKGTALLSLAKRLDSAAAAASEQCRAFEKDYGALQASAAQTVQSASADCVYQGVQVDVALVLLYLRRRLRAVRGEALGRVQSAQKVYRVESGDTPESIAASQLGSRARAGELGLSGPLVVGDLIEIPGA